MLGDDELDEEEAYYELVASHVRQLEGEVMEWSSADACTRVMTSSLEIQPVRLGPHPPGPCVSGQQQERRCY